MKTDPNAAPTTAREKTSADYNHELGALLGEVDAYNPELRRKLNRAITAYTIAMVRESHNED